MHVGDDRISLLEPAVEKPHKSRVMAFTVAALAFTLAVVLWFTFRYYPEKKAAAHFFDALVAGDTNKAYELWKPSATYRMSDFTADWGPAGYYGPVKSYKIMSAKAPKRSDSIEVDVAISPFSPMPEASDGEKSRKTKVVPLWILPSDKSISFPP
ncbi:MAG TPA: hypothetical protein VGR58_07335 [Candidatus Acidoferrum sp.]|nr:hypothetical protein [Candidatus Acidoferrum sp.]